MRDHLDDLAPAEVAVITFTTVDRALAYHRHHDLPFPVVIDPSRSSYGAYGFGRGTVRRVWGWRAARRYVQVVKARGPAGLRAPTEDTLQLGGDVVIAPDGSLAWGFWGAGPDDRPTVDALVDAAARWRRRP